MKVLGGWRNLKRLFWLLMTKMGFQKRVSD